MRNFLVISLLLGLVPVQAGATQFVQNGDFENTTPNPLTNKTTFVSAQEKFWTGGAGPQTYVAPPGTATNVNQSPYVRSPFPATSPTGGNFVMADGATDAPYGISQVINGLTIGQSYTLTFYQAAAQEYNFTGDTTEWWDVTFGNSSQRSNVMSTPSTKYTDWQLQTMSFVASSTSQTLTFFAGGGPAGGPPFSFLDGVSLVNTAVPEPATWGMIFLGVGLVGTALRRRRRPTLATA